MSLDSVERQGRIVSTPLCAFPRPGLCHGTCPKCAKSRVLSDLGRIDRLHLLPHLEQVRAVNGRPSFARALAAA